ncbi:MAG TPA: adenylate/guanylate cyclase domain-containing protein [Candidatus Cloacimonadota bacterium]|nr:adenylate/guanylate cyclase domain-containing protein [Candidatus Cloacimonadota bacterium]HPS37834.1 adenylate/guanylate cyclase domain-containing protein [Candidatus Cloacimonadota bacterium]
MDDKDLIFGGDFFDIEADLLKTPPTLKLHEGELREVAVLFADIKGFSSISNLFDAETIHARMDEIMKIFTKCINFYGGAVDKYMGDGIMALFGAKEASEQDTERCIMAAIKMQQQLQLYNSLLSNQKGWENLQLGLRIGINTGLVSVGKIGDKPSDDHTVYGPPVNLASRMESNAPVNSIMLPLETKRLVERNFDFELIGDIKVKGFEEAIQCWKVLGPKQDSQLHRRNHATSYIGREKELSILQDALTILASGKTDELPIMGIRGEAGLGKTRLVYEFEKQNQTTAKFLHGACSAISPAPLNLFTSMFETLFHLQVNETPQTKQEKLDSGFRKLIEETESEKQSDLIDVKSLIGFLLEIRSADPRLRQSGGDLLTHLSNAIETVFDCLTHNVIYRESPLVVILDDLHWIDEASSHVLENLLNRFGSLQSRVMFILMYRNEYQMPSFVSRSGKLQEIVLNPLPVPDIHRLVKLHIKGAEVPDSVLDRVCELSEGNPFFLEEWCNYIEEIPTGELVNFPVPANLHAMILSRLDKLPQTLRMVLHKASVIGQEFFVDILREVEKRLDEQINIDNTLDVLESQSLILKMLGFEYSTYFFKHITTREVAYQTLLHENRKMLHKLTAEAIEGIFQNRLSEFYYTLGDHYFRAEINDKAVHYLLLSAESSAKIYNNQQALDLYSKALSLEEDELAKLRIRFRIADINFLIGNWKDSLDEVRTIHEGLLDHEDDHLLFEVLRFLGISAVYAHDMEKSLDCFTEGLKLAETLGDPVILCIANGNMGNWYQISKIRDKALEYHKISLQLATDNHDAQRRAKTLSNLGLLYLDQKDYDNAELNFNQSLDISIEHRYLKEESIALGNLGYTKMLRNDYSAAMELLGQKLQLAEKMNDKLELIKVLGNIGNVHSEQKNYLSAVECYRKILELRLYLGDEKGAEQTQELIKKTLDKQD